MNKDEIGAIILDIINKYIPDAEPEIKRVFINSFNKVFTGGNPLDGSLLEDVNLNVCIQNFLTSILIECQNMPFLLAPKYQFIFSNVFGAIFLTLIKLPAFDYEKAKEANDKFSKIMLMWGQMASPEAEAIKSILKEKEEALLAKSIPLGFNTWKYGNERLEKLKNLLKAHGFIVDISTMHLLFSEMNPPKVVWKNTQGELIYLIYLLNEKKTELGNSTIHSFASKSFTVNGKEVSKTKFSKSLSKIFKTYEKDKNQKPESILLIEKIAKDCIS